MDRIDKTSGHPGNRVNPGKEASFLRLCLQARWRPEALEEAREVVADDVLDWEGLLTTARGGGVAPLLYDVTREQNLLPSPLEARLRTDYFATARRNVLLFDELERVLGGLEAAGVPAIVLKGAALAEAVYGNPAVRPMADVDLLVREEHVPSALRALAAANYRAIPPRAYRCEVLARKPGETNAVIELHWSLFVPFYYQYSVPMDWFWATALPLELGGASTRMLGPEAQLLHLCGHLLLHHGGAQEAGHLWLYDLAAVISRYEPRLDWDDLVGRAQAYDLVLPLQRILPRVSETWRAPIPIGVLERVANLRPSRTERQIVERLGEGQQPAMQRLWSGLGDLPGWWLRLRFAWRNLFPPAGYLEQIYRVPHPLLVPLCYPYRWLLGLWSVAGPRRRDPASPR
jgi:hypothetical protein